VLLTSKLTAKAQTTIPREVRERLGLTPGDSVVYEVDDVWIFRFPRRAEVVEWLRAEAALLPKLAPRLPVPVPRFDIAVFGTANAVGYRKLLGRPLAHGTDNAALGDAVGRFLNALHAFPVDVARRLVRAQTDTALRRFADDVLPLLGRDTRMLGERLLADARDAQFEAALTHADLGPEHLLHVGDELTGVIDWSDARVGDPAIDFAWTLYGTGPSFADALAHAYGGIDDATRARALVFHKLGPWHEVVYGLDTDQPEFVATGLLGARSRLRA
jgi:AbrB family looped-hinge helix DNA binding protein